MIADARWRTCIDFGTAMSKASVCAGGLASSPGRALVHPLAIGAIAGHSHPYMTPSLILLEAGRAFFGPRAAARAEASGTQASLIRSFKMFLAAANLEASLAMRLRRELDPAGALSQRDTLVLYIGYLLQVVEEAMRQDGRLPPHAPAFPRRYAYPLWRPDARAHDLVAKLFDEAAALPPSLTRAMLDPSGVNIAEARAALDCARANPLDGQLEAGVFEAHAAAECHFAFQRNDTEIALVVVFDMGAGTTDLTALQIERTATGARVVEAADMRKSVALACDEVDKILAAFIVDRLGRNASKAARQQLGRSLGAQSRALKEELFRSGSCRVTFERTTLSVRLADLMNDTAFKSFRAALLRCYQDYLTDVARLAAQGANRKIGVVLAGGGAALPFIQQMVQNVRPSASAIRAVDVQPIIPEWAAALGLPAELTRSFPQLSISIGGALANLPAAEARF